MSFYWFFRIIISKFSFDIFAAMKTSLVTSSANRKSFNPVFNDILWKSLY